MKVIDAHTHIFPPEIIAKRDKIAQNDPGFGLIYKDRGSRMADLDDLLAYMRRCGIAACVICGFPFKDKGLLAMQNDYLMEVGRSNSNIWPLAAIDTADEATALHEMDRCLKKRGHRGRRDSLLRQGSWPARTTPRSR